MTRAAPVVVVGAGITGLTIAHRLVRRGLNVRVLEAGSRIGGVVQTNRRDGFLLEQGPFTVMVRSETFAGLIHELGLTPMEVEAGAASKRYVLRAGQLQQVPTSLWGLLRTPLLSPLGKARVLRGIMRSAARPGEADETMSQVVSRRLGDEASQRLAAAAAVGIFAAEANELSFDACFPRFAQPDREAASVIGMMRTLYRPSTSPPRRRTMISFRDGLHVLIEALSRQLGDRIVTSQPVKAIEAADHGWVAVHAAGRTDASAIVLAVSPRTAAALIRPHVPLAADDLQTLPLTGLGIVHLGMRRSDVAHALDGFGFLVPPSELCKPLLGAIWGSSIFPHHAPDGYVLIRAIIGGTRWPDAMSLPEDHLASQTFDVLRPLLGLRGRPVLTQVHLWPNTVPVYAPGHVARIDRIHAALTRTPGLWCAGNWDGGLGINDRVHAAHALADNIVASQSR